MNHIPGISEFDGRRPQDIAVQPRLFTELLETVTTRDEPFENSDGAWGMRVVRPNGKGWRVSDYTCDRKTRWLRRRPIIWPVQMAGGWRRR